MKKFMALALALAMMVSCLVFTASAESNVVVALQGPATVQNGATFEVDVRVTDKGNIVGGVQGVIDVTGATVKNVEVNEELQTWNKTSDNTTIYKTVDNDITFAALNSLKEDSHDTRLWFKVTYLVTDASAVSVELKNVKVSDKSANLVEGVKTLNVNATVVDPVADPVITLNAVSMLIEENVEKQALKVTANTSFPNPEEIKAFGVVFYPTSLLGGSELTIGTQGAAVARVDVKDMPLFFESVQEHHCFDAKLNFGFSTKTNALKFLGTKVSARAFFITTAGDVVYSANNTVVDKEGNKVDNKYIKSGVAKKAVLNIICDNGDAIENPVNNDKADYIKARKALNISNENADWEANREFVLKYVVANHK
ncbi:MAG: hypothetical protein IIX54_06220 [Clostridia bacterium]|nr:hypothetical protein [Clostridia bacterium]